MPTEHDTGISKIDGIKVTGTPSTGQVITATGTTAANWQTPSGGGGSGFTYTGSGSPEGVQTGSVGETYEDTTHGGMYFKITGSATNTGWIAIAAANPGINSLIATGLVSGVQYDATALKTNPFLLCESAASAQVVISDTKAYGAGGTTNGLFYTTSGTDGDQAFSIFLGDSDQYDWEFRANGATQLPNGSFSSYPSAFSMGGGNTVGDYSIFISGIQTTNSTPTVLESVSGNVYSLQFPNFGYTGLVSGELVARRTDITGTDSVWKFEGVIRGRGAATPTYSWVGGSAPTLTLVAQDSAASPWTATVSIDTLNVFVTVTGQVGKTIDWTCKVSITDIQ